MPPSPSLSLSSLLTVSLPLSVPTAVSRAGSRIGRPGRAGTGRAGPGRAGLACEQRHNVVCERARARACAHASTITKRMSARKHRKKNARAHARTHRTPAAHKHARAHPAAHKHARAHTIAGTVSSPTTDRARAPRRFGHRAAAAASAPAPSPHHGRVGPRAAVPGPPAWARPGPRDLGGSRPGPGHGPRPARACPLAIIADACWHCDSDHRDSDLRLGGRSPCHRHHKSFQVFGAALRLTPNRHSARPGQRNVPLSPASAAFSIAAEDGSFTPSSCAVYTSHRAESCDAD